MICINVMTQKMRNALRNRRYNETEGCKKTRKVWHAAHPEKRKQYSATWLKANLARYKERRRGYRKRAAELRRDRKYGEGAHAHFLLQIETQGGLCAICHQPFPSSKSTNLDHNHTTNQWRGALCDKCNQALGLFQESSEILQHALDYLALWGERRESWQQNQQPPQHQML
jgi:hypothetical protein